MPICFYHKGCYDGAMSAAIASNFVERLECHAIHYGDDFPRQIVNDRDVYMLDWVPSPADVLWTLDHTESLTIIDHHKTAREALAPVLGGDNRGIIFDMDHSAAYLTWVHFSPKVPAPKQVLYIEDRDLWKWELPGSREVNAAIRHYYDPTPEDMMQFMSLVFDCKAMARNGEVLLDYVNKQAEARLAHVLYVQDGPYQVAVLNNGTSVSETGEALREHCDYSIQYFDVLAEGAPFRVLQLRAGKADHLGLGDLAHAHWGGGGHKAAAGARVGLLTDPRTLFLDTEAA